VLKRYGVGEGEGEIGSDFTSLVMPRVHNDALYEKARSAND